MQPKIIIKYFILGFESFTTEPEDQLTTVYKFKGDNGTTGEITVVRRVFHFFHETFSVKPVKHFRSLVF